MKEISKILKPIITIVFLSLLIACINDEDPKPPVVNPGSGVNIEGDWKLSCAENPEDGSSILSFKFLKKEDSPSHEQRFIYEQHSYTDSSCKQFTKTNTFPGKVTYHGEESRKTPSGKEAYETDLLFDDGEKWESLVALEDNDTTLYLAPGLDGAARPDDINNRNSFKLSKGTVPPPRYVDIDGTWQMDCIYFEDDEYGMIWTIKFSGERFSFLTSVYSDNSCTQLDFSVLDGGKVIYGKEITTPSGLTAHEIDLQFTGNGLKL